MQKYVQVTAEVDFYVQIMKTENVTVLAEGHRKI